MFEVTFQIFSQNHQRYINTLCLKMEISTIMGADCIMGIMGIPNTGNHSKSRTLREYLMG